MVATENVADVSIDRIIEHMTGEALEQADHGRPARAAPQADGRQPLLAVAGLACRVASFTT